MERPGEGKEYITATGETRGGEIVQNGHWRDQVRGDSTELPLERPGEGESTERSLERPGEGRQ